MAVSIGDTIIMVKMSYVKMSYGFSGIHVTQHKYEVKNITEKSYVVVPVGYKGRRNVSKEELNVPDTFKREMHIDLLSGKSFATVDKVAEVQDKMLENMKDRAFDIFSRVEAQYKQFVEIVEGAGESC